MTPENKALALEHARSAMPKEACGVVIVERGREVFVPCRNIAQFIGEFEIDPSDYAKAELRGEIVEIFHSHCYGSPRPSEVDKVVCEQTKLKWSIVSVPNGDWFEFSPSGYKAPLVGRAWAHGSLDCYSLIRDYYRETLGMWIPDFDRDHEWWNKGDNLYVENFRVAGFQEVPLEEVRLHDVILMQLRSPVINHGAIYLGNDLMLHHVHRRLSCREVWDGYYKKNSAKVVRHQALCER